MPPLLRAPTLIKERGEDGLLTAKLMFRPVVLSENRPNTSPIATTGITSQLSHPRRGMNATNAATSATIPISAEITFNITDL